MEELKTEAEKRLEPNLLKTIRKFSLMIGLIHDVALMRYYQKSFFRERENERLKREYLSKSKEYEKKVDTLIESLWPGDKTESTEQQKLF